MRAPEGATLRGRGLGIASAHARQCPRPTNNRCQTRGGARAWNRSRGDAANSKSMWVPSRSRLETSGNGHDGGSAGSREPAKCMFAQMAQWSAKPASFEGATGMPGKAAGGLPVQPADNSDQAGLPMRTSKWTCPNDNANCNASTKSANRAPIRMFDRNQPIKLRSRLQSNIL